MAGVRGGAGRKAAQRGSKVCTGFQSVARIPEIFDAFRDAAAQAGHSATPGDLAIRRNVAVAASVAEAQEIDAVAKETA
jgi:alkanesulfonate monooxygenase SsuD/methylene tetrahydromethanopterin reductase-like flavin-dependent oxidoreductase (luciferase family)